MNTSWWRRSLAPLLLLPAALAPGLLSGPAARADAPAASANTLHDFLPNQSYYTEGATPEGPLTQGPDGYFYGTTSAGSTYGNGTIFKIYSGGGGVQVLHVFSAVTNNVNTDGATPLAGLTLGEDGFFYGVTTTGGAHNLGTIFKISASGNVFTVLHSFAAGEGSGPVSALVQAPSTAQMPNGYLFGTTPAGGTNGNGTAFLVTTDGSVFSVLHTFSAVTSGANADGAHPKAGLTLGGGYLFGVASAGGAHNTGEIFAISLANGVFSPLYSFTAKAGNGTNADGAGPVQTLTLDTNDNFLYSVAPMGGTTGNGTFFKIGVSGTGFQALRSFQNSAESVSTLALARDKQFYGTNPLGGMNSSGGVLRLSPDGLHDVLVLSFDPLNSGTNNIGSQIDAPLVQGYGHDPALYGVAAAGGNYGSGTVFQLNNALLPPHTHILWNNANGSAAVWIINADGSFSSVIFPANGYTANGISDAPDGTIHLLWNNPQGAASVWTLDKNGTFLFQYTYTAANYKLVSLATSEDGFEKLLWQRTDGQASVWNADPRSGQYTHIEYGPVPNWKPVLVGAAETLDLFWQRSDGLNSLWSADLSTAGLVAGPTFLPDETGYLFDYFYTPTSYPPGTLNDGYQGNGTYLPQTPATLVGLTVQAYSTAGGQLGSPEYLWSNADGSISLNFVGLSDTGFDGPNLLHDFGPYPGWTPKAVAAGPDNHTHILWNDVFGTTALWDLDAQGYSFTNAEYGPYIGWTAVAVSAGP